MLDDIKAGRAEGQGSMNEYLYCRICTSQSYVTPLKHIYADCPILLGREALSATVISLAHPVGIGLIGNEIAT